MNTLLKEAFDRELEVAGIFFEEKAFAEAFSHLENAHVLGQQYFVPHFKTHLWMLRVGWARKDFNEIRGQLLRLALTPLGHLTGRLPLGNTGGANVSAFKPMPISAEMGELINKQNLRS